MEPDQQGDSKKAHERAVLTAGRIVKYSREIYHLESATEVANITLEAAPNFIAGTPAPAVVEIRRDDDLRVLGSMQPDLSTGANPGSLARKAYDNGTITIRAPAKTELAYDEDELIVDYTADEEREQAGVTIAAPTEHMDDRGGPGAISLLEWEQLERIEAYHYRPAR